MSRSLLEYSHLLYIHPCRGGSLQLFHFIVDIHSQVFQAHAEQQWGHSISLVNPTIYGGLYSWLEVSLQCCFPHPKFNSWSLIKHSKRHRICFSNSRECTGLVFSWDPWGSRSRPSALWLTMPGVSHALAAGWFVLSSDHAVELVSLAFRLESFQSKEKKQRFTSHVVEPSKTASKQSDWENTFGEKM